MALLLSQITSDFFSGAEGRTYRFQQPGAEGYADLELLELEERKEMAGPGGRVKPFSLLFRLVGGELLQPGLPKLLHPDCEAFEMSLQRIMPPQGHRPDAVYYEAVFG